MSCETEKACFRYENRLSVEVVWAGIGPATQGFSILNLLNKAFEWYLRVNFSRHTMPNFYQISFYSWQNKSDSLFPDR